jgi:hypothetical protein
MAAGRCGGRRGGAELTFAQIIARDFPQPRGGREREEDAQEDQQEIDQGGRYTPVSGPVDSGGRCPKGFAARL